MAERVFSRGLKKGRKERRIADMTILPNTSYSVDPDSLTRELRDLEQYRRNRIRKTPSNRKLHPAKAG